MSSQVLVKISLQIHAFASDSAAAWSVQHLPIASHYSDRQAQRCMDNLDNSSLLFQQVSTVSLRLYLAIRQDCSASMPLCSDQTDLIQVKDQITVFMSTFMSPDCLPELSLQQDPQLHAGQSNHLHSYLYSNFQGGP